MRVARPPLARFVSAHAAERITVALGFNFLPMNSAQLIASMTPARPHDCACQTCQKLCEHTPCLGTPQDIARLILDGFAPVLAKTLWLAGARFGLPAISMVQIAARPSGACPLLNSGKCTIHPIKPTGGKLATHTPLPFAINPDLAVALTWLLPANRTLVNQLLSLDL